MRMFLPKFKRIQILSFLCTHNYFRKPEKKIIKINKDGYQNVRLETLTLAYQKKGFLALIELTILEISNNGQMDGV